MSWFMINFVVGDLWNVTTVCHDDDESVFKFPGIDFVAWLYM